MTIKHSTRKATHRRASGAKGVSRDKSNSTSTLTLNRKRQTTRRVPNSSARVFDQTDMESGNGFMTYVWGPGFWMTLHTISLNYPVNPTPDQKKQYKAFFDSIGHVLPCGKCRENLVRNKKETHYGTRVFRSRKTLSRWVYDLHNHVNAMLGKKIYDTSYEDMCQMYENFRARCGLADSSTGSSLTSSHLQPSPMMPRAHDLQKLPATGTSRVSGQKCQRLLSNASKADLKVKEAGCTIPVHTGVKSKCVLRIIPKTDEEETMLVDSRCLCERLCKSNAQMK